jgi:hypothetical protein
MSLKKSNENHSKTSADTNVIHSKQRIAQNYLLIWISTNIDKSIEDYRNTVTQLQSVVNDINTFTKLDEAVDFLTDIYEMKVFLIAEDTIGQQIMSFIYDVPQLDSVYIFCKMKTQPEEWTKKWAKIKGVHIDATSVCQALHKAAKQCDQDSIPVSFITVNEETLSQNMNQLDPSFMYTRIFKKNLLDMKYDEQSIKDLANYYRTFYSGNSCQLKIIDEFEDNYQFGGIHVNGLFTKC